MSKKMAKKRKAPEKKAAVQEWTAPRAEYPDVLTGLDSDGWYGLRIGSAYCGWTHASDRSEVLRGVLEVADRASKRARARVKELETLLQEALQHLERVQTAPHARTKRPIGSKKA